MLGSRQQDLRMSSLRTMIRSEENISHSLGLASIGMLGVQLGLTIVDVRTLKLNCSHLDYSCYTYPTIYM